MTGAARRRRRRGVLAVILATGCAIAAAASGLAYAQDEIPVTLRAKTFQYNRTTKILTASGDVVVTYQDVAIRADRLRADLSTNEVHAEGNVVIEVGGRKVRGAAVDYNLTSRRGRISQAAADYTGPMVLGAVHLRAEVVEGVLGGTTRARMASCTTCESPSPVAYLIAREFTVYPNDKIVGRQVSVWIGGRRILTWPYFVIFIREPRASRLLPVVGYSQYEGYYVKTFYSYSINENHYGYLRLDLMEKLGTGIGVEHTYRLQGGNGNLFLYRLDNRQIGGVDSRIVLNHQQQLGDVSAHLYTDFLSRTSPLAPSTDWYTAMDLYYRGPVSSTTLYQTYARSDFFGFSSTSYSNRVIHTQQLTPALSAEVVADFSRVSGALGTNDELFPRLTLYYRGAGYTASLVAEGRIDPDGDAFLGDVVFTTERLPELTVALDPRLVPGTRLFYQLQASLGRYREMQFTGTVDAIRSDVSATISGPLLLSDRGYLALRAQVRGSYYSTGDARAFLSSRVDYTRTFSDDWQAQVGVTYQDQAGRTPFTFDQTFGRVATSDVTLTYRRPNLLATLQGGYDGVAGRPIPVVARAQFSPRQGWSIATALSYDPALGGLSRAEIAFDIQLSPLWQVVYYGFYDGTTGHAYTDRLTITRTWQDCLATALTYRGFTQEVWLEAWLTALPWARGRVGIGPQGTVLVDQPWLGQP